MESFSISVDCPDPEQLLNELWPKLDEYCKYEVFEYASGKVIMIAFEKVFKADSSLLATIAMDFTSAGRCQIDIIAGGGEYSLNFRSGAEKDVVTYVIQIFIDICEAKRWNIQEYKSQSAE
jgi:hypothetical protein